MTAAAASETFEAATGERASRAAAGAEAIAPPMPEMMLVTCSVPAYEAYGDEDKSDYANHQVIQV